MNDTLVRLMNEAQIIDPASGAIMHVKRENFQKFAELIVKNCLSMIENEAEQYAEPVWAVELINDIKDRFGVKE